MPFYICTTQHLQVINFVPILLPTAPYQPHFPHTGSTFPSPEQLSISGRFCHVTIIPYFPDNGFNAGPQALSGQLSILYLASSPFHS